MNARDDADHRRVIRAFGRLLEKLAARLSSRSPATKPPSLGLRTPPPARREKGITISA